MSSLSRSRGSRALRGTVLALALGLGASSLPAQAALAAEPGSAGAGDPYFPKDGNGGYDVAHYDIHDTYGIRSGELHGWTRVTATATQDLSRFNLDLVLTPSTVKVDGAPASFAKAGRHELVVTPASPLVAGQRFTVTVRYAGRPGGVVYGEERPFLRSRSEALATNEPHIAPWWFPANDHPTDKATFAISVRVAKGNQVFSNGELRGRDFGERWTTWRWRVDQEISTYLAYFAAGKFRWETGTSHGLRYWNAVSRGLPRKIQDSALRALRRSPGIVAWQASQFGRYPFSSTGGVVTSLDGGFALENASRPTYPWWGSYAGAVGVEVHELAHQWFGDEVSVERWRDIWLNEGFASWVEWAYAEAHGGRSAQRTLLAHYRNIAAGDSFWQVKVSDPGPDRLFWSQSYTRGAMTLQALRHRIGRATFARLVRHWVEQHAYGNATTADFEALAEAESGEDLDGFFDAWLHSRTKPARTAANGLR